MKPDTIVELETIYADLAPDSYAVAAFGDPLSHITINPEDDCIDLGCGGGRHCEKLEALTKSRVVGLDIQQKMLDYAKEHHGSRTEFILGDMLSLPFLDASFDKVVSNCAFTNIADKKKGLSEIKRILKPGGQFCIVDLTINNECATRNYNSIDSRDWLLLLNSTFTDATLVSEIQVVTDGTSFDLYVSTFVGTK